MLLVMIVSAISSDLPKWVKIDDGQLISNGHHYRPGIYGNSMSPYWFGRIMAYYGGYDYINNQKYEPNDLIDLLPKFVAKDLRYMNSTEFNLLKGLSKYMYDWCHEIETDWLNFHNIMIHDIRHAVQTFASNNNIQLRTFNQSDVVVHVRCSYDTLFSHNLYGPFGFSYLNLIPQNTTQIYVVGMLDSTCKRVVYEPMVKFLSQTHPQAIVTHLQDTVFKDFTALVYAPTLLASQSSFGLMGLFGNAGRVYYTRGQIGRLRNGSSIVDIPILYPKHAQSLGISLKTPDSIIEWQMTH